MMAVSNYSKKKQVNVGMLKKGAFPLRNWRLWILGLDKGVVKGYLQVCRHKPQTVGEEILTTVGFSIAPKTLNSSPEVTRLTMEIGARTGGTFKFESHPRVAVEGAQAIYTDVWATLGQEDEAEARKTEFMPWQLNEQLPKAAPDDALIMHDLPAHRSEEITGGVMDHPNSVIFDQAENRLHARKGLLVFLAELSR